MATDKLKRHKSPATDQIPAELITAGASTIRSELNKLINSMLNCLRSGRIRSLYLFIGRGSIIVTIYRKSAKKYGIHFRGLPILSTTNEILSKTMLSSLTPYAKEIIGDNQWDFHAICSYESYILHSSNI